MKLHSPAFERRLRRRIQHTIRRSPELKRQARRGRRSRHYQARSLFRLLLSVIAAGATFSIASKSGHPAPALAFVGIWLGVIIIYQVLSLAQHLYASPDLPALSLLPLETRTIFRRQLGRYLRHSLWLLVDLAAMLGTLMFWLEWPAVKGLVLIPAVTLAWLITLALVGLALRHCSSLPYGVMATLTYWIGIIILVCHSFVGAPLLALLERSADTLNLLLPTTWPLALLRAVAPDGSPRELLFLIPSLSLIWTLRHTVRQLAATYEFAEPLEPEAADVLPHGSGSESTEVNNASGRVGVTAIAEYVATREFLTPATASITGWFEVWWWRWLTDHERNLAELAFPETVRITRRWKKIYLHLIIGGVTATALGQINPAFQTWAWLGTILITVFRGFDVFYAKGRAFSPLFCSGVNLQLHTVYPVGYRELSRVLFKYTLVQLPVLLGYLAICGGAIAHLTGLGWAMGVIMGCKAALLLAAARGPIIAMAFSAGTNDSSRFRLHAIALIGMFLSVGAVFAGLAVACVRITTPVLSFGLGLGALLAAWGFWRLYGRFYNANRFDVMNVPHEAI